MVPSMYHYAIFWKKIIEYYEWHVLHYILANTGIYIAVIVIYFDKNVMNIINLGVNIHSNSGAEITLAKQNKANVYLCSNCRES